MFLRFYNVPKDEIKAFVDTIRAKHPAIKSVRYVPLRDSVNFLLPEGEHTQINMTFKTKADQEKLMTDAEMQQAYIALNQKYTGTVGAFALQRKGDPAYRVVS